MDTLLSAVAGDLIGRLVSFLIGKYQEPSDPATAVRLQRALVRAHIVVEEAEGRQIANQAMLQQLIKLRQQLCRAAYALDAFRCRSHAAVSRSRSRTRLPPPSSVYSDNTLFVMVEGLEATLSDMREFVVLLAGCPRVNRQPYSTYLFMESYMFGRQMEKEEIIGFLLSKHSRDLDVLPIIGPHEVGKRTLVEHVCLDERVRERFAKIHHLRSDELDLRIDWSFLFDFTARSLTVIDMVDGDADAEESCRRFHSAARRRGHSESKIIVISRMEAHSSLGTVPTLRLCAPSQEELWYFFRTLAFGATDPDERPDLVRIAMSLLACISDISLFTSANIIAASLRADLSVQSWHRLLKVFSGLKPHDVAGDGLHEHKGEECCLIWPVKDAPGASCFFYNRCKFTSVARSELPKVTVLEMLTGGSLPPPGNTRFDVLVWQSRIPPYGAYVATCDMEKARQLVGGGKRARKRRSDLQLQHDDHQRTRKRMHFLPLKSEKQRASETE